MVTPVENLTSVQNSPALNVPSGTGNVAGSWQNDLGTGNPAGLGHDLAGLGNSTSNEFGPLDFNMTSINYSAYGPIAYNPRMFGALQQDIRQSGYNFENGSITEEDRTNLEPMADRLDESRPFLNIRIFNRQYVTQLLQDFANTESGVGLYLTNCAKDGLKDPNQQVSFENLKNPLRLIKELKSLSVNTPEANENIDLLSDIAVKQRSPEMAACLLEGTSEGGLTSVGVDFKTAKKILIDSKSKFDNEGDYYNYLTNINQAYKKLFPGKSLDSYIEDNYKPVLQKAAPIGGIIAGAAASALLLSNPLGWGIMGALAIGATVGGIAGTVAYSLHTGLHNEDGKKLFNIIGKARTKDHNLNNINNYAFGQYTVPGIN